jgi:hypothetical protein
MRACDLEFAAKALSSLFLFFAVITCESIEVVPLVVGIHTVGDGFIV